MMKTKFTEGPWWVSRSNEIGTVPTMDVKIVSRVSGANPEEAKANGYLIARAPEMYTEISHLIHELNHVIEAYNKVVKDPSEFFDAESCHKAQILLAKARGESS
jgi:hypothetical protein